MCALCAFKLRLQRKPLALLFKHTLGGHILITGSSLQVHHDSACVLQIIQDIMVSSCQKHDSLAVHTHTHLHNLLDGETACRMCAHAQLSSSCVGLTASSARPDEETTADGDVRRAREESEGRGGAGRGVYLGWRGCGGTPHCRAWPTAKLFCYQGNAPQPGI